MSRWLFTLAAREWLHHPWRHAAALLAVALGVALASSVQWINASALDEFGAALRATQGRPDLVLRGPNAGFDDTWFDRAVLADGVATASPVLELQTYARAPDGSRVPLRVLGVDALVLPLLAPELVPQPGAGHGRTAMLDPELVYLNVAALEQLGLAVGGTLALQSGAAWLERPVAGVVAAGGTPLAVMDLAGAQRDFGRSGQLTRIDLRLEPGADADALASALALPPTLRLAAVDEGLRNASQLSRAYRVNLTVLALVALFVGAFLVYSVIALSVAQRLPMLALLGVLGMTARERRALVLVESLLIGAAGSVIGLLGGAALAALALRWLAGDLGGGYFTGLAPPLRVDATTAAAFFALGVASAAVGAWRPSRAAERLQPAVALKGLASLQAMPVRGLPGALLLAGGVVLALLPPWQDLPLAAYGSVALLLFGGIAWVPAAVGVLLAAWPRPRGALALLAVRRANFQRQVAIAAVSGVVASLALSVALTVMVASFRSGVAQWLDAVLPADLYARTATQSAAADQAWLPAQAAQQAARLPGVQRVQASRLRALQLSPTRPAVTLIAREFDGDPTRALPLLGAALPETADVLGVWVSEPVATLYGAAPGTSIELPLGGSTVTARVLGIWRDYARQFGAIVMRAGDYRRLSGDTRINDLALWLAPGADLAAVHQGLRALAADPAMIEFASAREIRATSLRIFDRSFAVTVYLQAVAIAVGLVGVAASLSAQVLARRKEFGLLAHLGLTRRQVLAVVAGEAAAWLVVGAVLGLALGAAVAGVLVHVVNPQSFHWTMDIVWPWPRLAALAAAVIVGGTVTAAWAARRAVGRAAVLSVKEDW